MKNKYIQSQSNTKQKKVIRLFNDKILLGLFSIVALLLAVFGTFFLNPTQAKTVNFGDSSQSQPNTFATPFDAITGCPTDYTALGGTISSDPTASVINSRVVVFAKGTDGAIYYQISTGFPFSGWRSLGGGTNATPKSIVIGLNLYIEVVGTDGKNYYRSTIDGTTYSDWKEGTVGASTNSTAILSNINYTFLRGASGTQPNLCTLLSSGATPSPTVTPTPTATGTPPINAITGCPIGYTALGGIVSSVPTASALGNRVVVFAKGSNGEIYFQHSTGGSFSGWDNLSGVTNSAPMSIVIGSSVFVEIIGTDGLRYFKSSSDGLGFSNWTQGTVGATINPTAIAGTTLYSFVSGLTGTQPNLCAVVTTGVTPSPTPTANPTVSPTVSPTNNPLTGCPTGFLALGGIVSSAPTAGVVDNRVVVFARGSDGAIYYQYSASYPFSGWISLGGNSTAAAPKSTMIGTALYVEVTGTDNKQYYRSTPNGLAFSDWTQGTVGGTTSSTAILGTTGYSFVSGLTGTQPNLCTVLTQGVTPTPTPVPTVTITPTPTPTVPPTTDAITGCKTNFTALGGVVTSNPTVGVVNSRVIAYAKGTDNGIYYQLSTGGNFSGWISLGGAGAANSTPRSILIGSTLYVEIVGTDSLNYFRSTSDGVSYSGWAQGTFGATTTSTAILGSTGYDFASGLTGSQPNLCVLATAGVISTPTPTPTPVINNSTGCASDYVSLGGFITSRPTTNVFNNRVYVFARGTDGTIYYQYSTNSTFSGWNSLGGGTNDNPKSIVIGSTMYIEVIGTDSKSYYRSTTDGTTFSAWTAGTVNATTNASSVFGGKTYTFAIGLNNTPHLCVNVQ